MNRGALWILRWIAVLFLVVAPIAVGRTQQQSAVLPPPAPSPERAAVNRYCVGCHNNQLKTAGLELDTIGAQSLSAHQEAWEKVVRKLRSRYMPPPGMPRPDERTYDALVSSLEASLDNAAAAKPNPGRTDTFRRLNRTEYQNAIRDLLALEVDVASLLPGDESSQGRLIAQIHPRTQPKQGNGAKHRPGIEKLETKPFGQNLGGAALAGAGRAVDGDDHGVAQSAACGLARRNTNEKRRGTPLLFSPHSSTRVFSAYTR